MKDILKNVSHLIEEQYPFVYQNEGPELVAFTKAYFEFMESTDKYSIKMNRQMFEYGDIDTTIDAFLIHFKNKYLVDFPYHMVSSKRFAVKHIMDYYRSKGSEKSLELLMRLMFGVDTEVYYPGTDLFRLSNSKWFNPAYLELTLSERTASFINRQIVGSSTGSTAFVEAVVRKRVNGKLIDIIYLSDIKGSFLTGELITDNEFLLDAPKIVGSLTNIILTQGGRSNNIGDIFEVKSADGNQAQAKITSIKNSSGLVDFKIEKGGFGFTTEGNTQILISNNVVNVSDNVNLDYIIGERIIQPIEKITTISSSSINNGQTGQWIEGIVSGNTVVANGTIISVANTDANGNIISSSSANSEITIQVNSGSFANQISVTTSTPGTFVVGEIVETEQIINLNFVSPTGTFVVGEIVDQTLRESVSNTIISYAFGTVSVANSTQMTLNSSWGTFIANNIIEGKTSGATASLASTFITLPSSHLTTTAISNSTVFFGDKIVGSILPGVNIRGSETKNVVSVVSTINTGASDIWLEGNSSSNGVIDTVTDVSVSSVVVGQNTSSVGLNGDTSSLFTSSSANGIFIISTDRSTLISPPLYANGSIKEIVKSIVSISTGYKAGFKIGLLENTENIIMNTDNIDSKNSNSVLYRHVSVDGSNSGIGFVNSFTINNGGTGYSNGAGIIFSSGGYANGQPYTQASASISTNSTGVISAITVNNPGEGFYENVSFSLPSTTGTVANVNVIMTFGYGFPHNPIGNLNTSLFDVLNYGNFTIGSIAELNNIDPGINYNTDPFVHVITPPIASFNRRNFFVNISNLNGSFIVGESVVQNISQTSSSKGIVLSANTSTVLVGRNSFNIAFQKGIAIAGAKSGATANVVLVIDDDKSESIGDNASITGSAIAANGIAVSAEVINSGYGYVNDKNVDLVSSLSPYLISGTAKVVHQGTGEGYWTSFNSQISDESKIQDSDYYQEYSYDVKTSLSLNRYSDILKKVLHVAGTKMFGTVVINSTANLSINIANSTLEII